MQKNKTILVTGGAGFIGSHVVDLLISSGYRVRVLDNLTPPTHAGKRPRFLNKKAEFIKGDVRKKADWKRGLSGVANVFHLAAHMDQHPDFSRYIRTNIESAALLFECIAEDNLPITKVIASSSQAVYGEGKYRCNTHGTIYPLPRSEAALLRGEWNVFCPRCGKAMSALPQEEGDQLLPQSTYGISKKAAEELLLHLGQRHGIPTVSLRYSIPLGPRQSLRHFYSGALRAFTLNALSGEPMKMNEDGLQTRDFVGVGDAARAHLIVLEDARANFQSFNVGSGEATRIMDLAKLVAEEAGVPFNPSTGGRFRLGDARDSVMSVAKLQALSWKRRQTLREVVREYVAWVREEGVVVRTLARNYATLKKEGILKNW